MKKMERQKKDAGEKCWFAHKIEQKTSGPIHLPEPLILIFKSIEKSIIAEIEDQIMTMLIETPRG